MKTKHTTFYRTVLDSPQWKSWVRYNELEPHFDVHESMETGWMSQKHFQAFLAYCKTVEITQMEFRLNDKIDGI